MFCGTDNLAERIIDDLCDGTKAPRPESPPSTHGADRMSCTSRKGVIKHADVITVFNAPPRSTRELGPPAGGWCRW